MRLSLKIVSNCNSLPILFSARPDLPRLALQILVLATAIRDRVRQMGPPA